MLNPIIDFAPKKDIVAKVTVTIDFPKQSEKNLVYMYDKWRDCSSMGNPLVFDYYTNGIIKAKSYVKNIGNKIKRTINGDYVHEIKIVGTKDFIFSKSKNYPWNIEIDKLSLEEVKNEFNLDEGEIDTIKKIYWKDNDIIPEEDLPEGMTHYKIAVIEGTDYWYRKYENSEEVKISEITISNVDDKAPNSPMILGVKEGDRKRMYVILVEDKEKCDTFVSIDDNEIPLKEKVKYKGKNYFKFIYSKLGKHILVAHSTKQINGKQSDNVIIHFEVVDNVSDLEMLENMRRVVVKPLLMKYINIAKENELLIDLETGHIGHIHNGKLKSKTIEIEKILDGLSIDTSNYINFFNKININYNNLKIKFDEYSERVNRIRNVNTILDSYSNQIKSDIDYCFNQSIHDFDKFWKLNDFVEDNNINTRINDMEYRIQYIEKELTFLNDLHDMIIYEKKRNETEYKELDDLQTDTEKVLPTLTYIKDYKAFISNLKSLYSGIGVSYNIS